MKKVLFFVPHEDDEVFVGGPMIINLTKSKNYEVSVFIATNGDYYPFENRLRIKESLDGLNLMGVKKHNIYFGGYGDCWKKSHIYNSSDDTIKTSHGGFNKTHVDNKEYKEWHYLRFGSHAEYTRRNYVLDIQTIIEYLLPDIIVAVDLDSHQDHRCLSLILDEAMRNILCSSTEYQPILLKKYAYQCVLDSDEDFFNYPNPPTRKPNKALSNPYFLWNKRIRYKVPIACNSFFIRSSKLYKVIRKYKSQDMWKFAPRFINSDIVYWQRQTNNLALKAKISTTSGDAKFLNDFKLLDTDDVVPFNCNYKNLRWHPSYEDKKKSISIYLSEVSEIGYVYLYFNNEMITDTYKGNIQVFYNNNILFKSDFTIPKSSFSIVKIDVNVKIGNKLLIDFSSCSDQIGLGEIEIIPKFQKTPFAEFVYRYKRNNFGNLVIYTLKFLDCVSFKIQKLLYRHILNSYKIKRQKFNEENIQK